MERGIRFIGNGQAPVQLYWEHLRDMIVRKEIEPLHIVTTRAGLEDMSFIYEMYDKREPLVQKVFIETKHSKPPFVGEPQIPEPTM